MSDEKQSEALGDLDPTFVSYDWRLRFGMLEAVKDKPPEEACEMLNLLESVIDGELSPDAAVEAYLDGTLPKRYQPLTPKDQ